MIELALITATIYFVHRSWTVYKSGYDKAKSVARKATEKKNTEGLTEDEINKLKQILNQ